MDVKINTALISVFNKDGLDPIISLLVENNVAIYSTGGTYDYIHQLGVNLNKVEDLTGYPSILDGRVKTLHPKIFGGILAKRNTSHLAEIHRFNIPQIDLVIVDLYPFEATLKSTDDEDQIIEKIDIGGISLIRAAAKNFASVLIVSCQQQYIEFTKLLADKGAISSLPERKKYAIQAFELTSHYDTAIFNYLNEKNQAKSLKISFNSASQLRYGENPHQQAIFFGEIDSMFEYIGGKDLSFNNIADVDAAVALMREFKDDDATMAIIKHTNVCGIASRPTVLEAWQAALAADPVSAFGGIFIANTIVDEATAKEVDALFYEILIAPDFTDVALEHLTKNKKRIILKLKHFDMPNRSYKSVLNGILSQETDLQTETMTDLKCVTKKQPSPDQIDDLLFANKCAKHLKSNTIVLVKNRQMIGMGCGQTSRLDACHQAIDKARRFGFNTVASAMASDAFFPFPDCVEIAHQAGINAIVQPGGSIKDQLSIDFCNSHDIAMVVTGTRHFKH